MSEEILTERGGRCQIGSPACYASPRRGACSPPGNAAADQSNHFFSSTTFSTNVPLWPRVSVWYISSTNAGAIT